MRWARHQQGLRLVDVSDRADIAIGYLSEIERGSKTNIGLEALIQLAFALHVTPDFLLSDQSPALVNSIATKLFDP